jgi:hypothetical protein
MEQGKGEAVFPQSEFMNMISLSLDRPIEQVWRVKLHDDGSADLYSFAMPKEKNLDNTHRLNEVSLPQWVKERISILQICNDGEVIDGVGQRVSKGVYYVVE